MNIRRLKIGFIGSGNMAEALIKGLIASKTSLPKNILASDPSGKRRKYISRTYSVKTLNDNEVAAKTSDIVVIAVKPQLIKKVLLPLSRFVNKKHLVISIAAGVKIETLRKFLPNARVSRVMPNNPALVAKGMTAVALGNRSRLSHADLNAVRSIFSSVGKTCLVPESLMDLVTALSGSGPAFVYLFAEAIIKAGVSLGFTEKTAGTLVLQTISGAAETMIGTGKAPKVLREMVSSPGGTTLEGLKVFKKYNFELIIKKAVSAAAARAKELSKEACR